MTRAELFDFCLTAYGTSPDYPFEGDLKTAVLRHSASKKWYALVMHLSPCRLGLSGEKHLDVVNLKLPTEMWGSFTPSEGVYPAYHMHKLHWVSVVLSQATDELVRFLLHVSYQSTKGRKRK